MVAMVFWGLILVGLVNASAAIGSISVGFCQILAIRRGISASNYEHAHPDALPFVSVHVAIHDEPPLLVIATLDALAALNYPAFEVIVIDNNTPDPETWKPVEQHVLKLGSRFRFVHAEQVRGAKAGALNIALQGTDPLARYVAIVDADYQVFPEFLMQATSACVGFDFVQFPQSYRQSAGAAAVCSELSDYFSIFPSAANRTGASLLTGTLSLISIDALRRVGGWPTVSITEDAELGVTLWKAGARGRYLDRVVGTGLLPLNLAGLRQQRGRWAAGNVQTFLRALISPMTMFRPGGIAVAAQLTAWTGFLACPLLTLCIVAACRMTVEPDRDLMGIAEAIAVATITLSLLSIVGRAIATGRLGSLTVTLALIWTSSFAWLPAIFGKRLFFRRTPKIIAAREFDLPSLDFAASLAAVVAATIFIVHGSWLTGVVLALSASGLATQFSVDRTLRRAGHALL